MQVFYIEHNNMLFWVSNEVRIVLVSIAIAITAVVYGIMWLFAMRSKHTQL